MKFPLWLRNPIGRCTKSRKGKPARVKIRWSQLFLEILEERVQPSTVVWNVDASGSWDVPGNWSTGAVPGAGDDVFLDRPAGNFTITHGAGDLAVNSIHASRNGLVVAGGTLTIGAASELGDFSFSSVTLKGSLTTSGTVNWSAGAISSPFDDQENPINALTSTGTLNLIGPGDWTVVGELINSGAIVQTGGGLILLTTQDPDSLHFNESIMINQPSGLYSFQGAQGSISGDFDPFQNLGALSVSGGSFSINCRFLSHAASKIDVADNSQLRIAPGANGFGDELFAGTAITVGQAGLLEYTKGEIESGFWTASGKGSIELESISGSGPGVTTLSFPAGMLHWTGIWNFDFDNLGFITVDRDGSDLNGPIVGGNSVNHGTIVQRGVGSLAINADLLNAPGGLYDIQNDKGFTFLNQGSFTNAGTLRKSAGVGTSTISVPVNNSGGTLDVQTGILVLKSGGTFADGIFDVAAGSFLDLSSIAYSGTFTGTGAGLVRIFTRLTLGPTGAVFNFNGQWVDGTWILGDTGLTNRGTLTIDGADSKLFTGVFTNAGTFIHRANGNLQLGLSGFNGDLHPGTLNNTIDGVYDFQADGFLDNGTPGPHVNNAGIIRKSAGSGSSGIGSGVNADINFTSTGGVFDIRSGTFTDFVGGTFTGGGVFNASAGAILDLAGDFIHPTIASGAFTGSGAGIVRFRGRELRSGAPGTTFNFPSGLLQWTASGQSTMMGADLTNLGSITLAGAGFEQISNTFNNAGTILHVGLGNLDLDIGAILTNQVGAVYDFQADQSVVDNGTFINRGALRKSGGTGTSSLSPHTFQNERGLIDVRSGILALNPLEVGSSTGGTFVLAKNAVLNLNSLGASSYTGTYTGSGDGVVQLGLVGAVFGGFGLTVAGATFNFPAGMFQWLGGTLDGGTIGFNNTSSITLAGADIKRLRGVLNNAGTIVHAGTGDLNFAVADTILNNLPGSLYDIQGDVHFTGNGAGYSLFNNAGTVRKSAGAGSAGPTSGFDFRNLGGTIDVLTGAFSLTAFINPASAHTGGTFNIAKGALLDLSEGNLTLLTVMQGSFSGSGEGFVLVGGGHVAVGAGGASFNFPPGMFQWTGGVIDGLAAPLTNHGSMTLPDFGIQPQLVGALNNAGTMVMEGQANLVLGHNHISGGAVLTNLAEGLLEFQGDGGLLSSINTNDVGLEFINQGTLRKSGPGTATISSTVCSNTGTLAVDAGTLSIQSPTISQVVGNTLSAGTWQASVGSDIDLATAPALTTNNAHIILDGPGSTFAKLDTLADNSGSLSLLNNRDFTTAGPLTNSGSLTLGAGSTLSVMGAYTQMAGATLSAQIGGDPASGQFGQLTSSGAAILDGTFDVTLTGGFGPAAGQSFQVMSFPNHTGSFSTYTGLNVGRFSLFNASLNDTNLLLSAQTSTADLAFDSFEAATFPTSATSGQNVTLTYHVKNSSDLPASGDWTDSVYLSADGVLDPDDALLARVDHGGGVGGMGSYSQTVTAAMPPLAAGGYRVIVMVDSRGLASDADRTNNTGVSSQGIAVTVPLLVLGTPVTGSIAPAQDLYFRVLAPPGQDVTVGADFAALPGAELAVRYGALPDRTTFDDASEPGQLNPRLLLSNAQGGIYYLHLRGQEDAAGAVAFTLKAEGSGFEITRVSPLKGSNLGQPAVLDLQGSQFTAQTMIHLNMIGGPSRAAQSILYLNANHIVALFDLTNLPAGSYQIVADEPGKSALGFDTFTVTSNPPGETGVFIWLKNLTVAQNGANGAGRTAASQKVAFGEYNTSDSPLPAPLYVIEADNVQPDQKTVGSLGSDTVPPRFLPGDYSNNDVQIVTYKPAVAGNGVTTTYELYVIEPTQALMDWDGQKENLRPDTIPPDAWDAVWANLRPQLGDTLADYWRLLTTDSEKLAVSGESVTDIERLFTFEVQKANNLPAVPVPAPAVDVTFPAPGLPLVFARSMGATIAGRYQLGPLGRGWSDNFDISIHEDTTTGLVTVSRGGQNRFFARQEDMSYLGLPGEFATLFKVSGAFQLRETTGELTAFRADGLLDYLEDANGNRITAGYTGGLLTSLTSSSGLALTLTYIGARLHQVIDPAGGVATYEYDAAGEHLIRVTTTAGTTEYAYTPDADGPRAHALTSITFLDGTHLFFDYDSQGRLVRQQGEGGADVIRYAYDVASFSVTDAKNQVTTLFYDDTFQILREVDALGRVSTIEYDASHRPVIVGASGGGQGSVGYDTLGNPTAMQNPLGETQAFTYTPDGSRLATWTDALGHKTQYAYDAQGNLTATTQVDGSTTQYSYDAQGNVAGTVDPLGQNIGFTYNSSGQVTRKDLPGGTHVDYIYTARGNLESVVDSTGTTRLEYLDGQNPDLLTKITYPNGRFLEYTYQEGRRTRMADQGGFAVNYSYDAAGRLDVLRDDGGNLIVDYEYDPVGRLARETNGNGTVTEYTYDQAGQLIKILNLAPGGAIQSQLVYAYDDLGRQTSVTSEDGVTTYGYDGAGRLIAVTLPTGQVITYVYDAAGNRIASSDDGATTNYTVNDLNQYVSVGSTTQTFDAAGNLVSSSSPGGNTTYRYDAEGRLAGQITPTGTWTYEYDALGNRIASVHDGVRTEFLVDPSGMGNVVGEYDGAGNLQAHYVDGIGLTSRVDATGAADYYQFDAGGNTTQLTGAGGAVLNSYSYLPFGESLATSESVANPFQYVGQLGVMREGSGIDYMRNRWYAAAQGRFTQKDPIGLAGGTNFYVYGGNNPVSQIDPSGLDPDPVWVELVSHAVLTGLGVGGLLAVGYVVGPGGAVPTSAGVAAAQGFRLLALETVVTAGAKGLLRGGLYALLAAEVAVIGFEVGYFARTVADKDTPECLPVVPGVLQPYCKAPPRPVGIIQQTLIVPQIEPATDPNDIVGPAGFGPRGFVVPEPPLSYQIRFLNKPEAVGPAEEVVVTQHLDPNLDLDTFELGDFGFGAINITVPTGRQFYSTRLDLRSTRGVFVDIIAQLDRAKRIVTWTFAALDPETMDLPSDPSVGFLPPDKTEPEGEGYVSYSIRAKPHLPSGSRIDAKATIVFDTNAPIDTNVTTNTIDVGSPTSSVTALPALSSTSFMVTWSGADDTGGSGIASYDIYVSDNGGAFTLFQTATTQTSAIFTGQADHTYGFYSVATDNVGHRELTPAGFQASTTVDGEPPTSTVTALPAFEPASFVLHWSGSDTSGASGLASFDIFVSDNGGAFTSLLTATTQTSTTFTGQDGHAYGFYSVATDNAGNRQATPGAAQATTSADSAAPTSTVTSLPTFEPASFVLIWSGSDATGGSGLNSFDVFVSDNGGAFTSLLTATTQTSTTFTGQDGHTYGFFSVAIDNAGNRQATPGAAQATTSVDADKPTSSLLALPAFSKPSFLITWSGVDAAGAASGIASFSIYVSDNGGAFTAFSSNTRQTSTMFNGVAEHTYGFYSVAIDNAGNRQDTPSAARASTQALLDTPNKKYVAAVYVDLLLRPVDRGGLDYWSGRLDNAEDRAIIAALLTHSAEYYQTNVIKPAYQQFLGRSADQGGLDYWTSQLEGGITDEQMQAGFIASPEFYYSANGGANVPVTPAHDRAWIDALYMALLDRPPDQTGEDFWTNQLQGNETRLEVANDFTGSKEGLSLRIQQTYHRYLDRPADAGGLAFWLRQYQMGAVNEDIVTGFVGSDEFFNQASK